MKKKISMLFLSMIMVLSLTACGENNASTTSVDDVNAIQSVASAVEVGANAATSTAKEPTGEHRHTMEYISNENSTHTMTCMEEGCDYTEDEICVYDTDFVCSLCNYKHEHNFETTSNEDGTHTMTCTSGHMMPYEVEETCVFNDSYECEVCGYKHEHTLEITSNGDGKHASTCSIESCGFETITDCTNTNGKCEECGYTFPVEKKAITIKVNHFDGTKWGTPSVYGYCDSIDEAFIMLTGSDWATIKATWTYHDKFVETGMDVLNTYENGNDSISIWKNGTPNDYLTNNNTTSYWFEYN